MNLHLYKLFLQIYCCLFHNLYNYTHSIPLFFFETLKIIF